MDSQSNRTINRLKLILFLKDKDIKLSAKVYGIDSLTAMAQGLLASLLIGTIIQTIGEQANITFLVNVGQFAIDMAGPAIAVSIGISLNASPLILFSLIPVGFASNQLGGAGGTLAVLLIAIIACECAKLVNNSSQYDIFLVPAVALIVGTSLSYLIAPSVGNLANALGKVIISATILQPFLMGIIVSVLVGIVLTLPISSAAICTVLGLTGLAGGAALAGCSAQMVGFAVISFRENGWRGLIGQGIIGTNMFQLPNIVRNPRIWIPPILASAITGPIATCWFHLEMNGPPVASGMGTCGLVGQIGVYTGWLGDISSGVKESITIIDWVELSTISFLFPALISWIIAVILRKINWIKAGDLLLP